MTTTTKARADEIRGAITSCEWLREFRDAGDWSRYRAEERDLVSRLDRLGVIPVRQSDGEIDWFATAESLMTMI
jgi:hypothetical protein